MTTITTTYRATATVTQTSTPSPTTITVSTVTNTITSTITVPETATAPPTTTTVTVTSTVTPAPPQPTCTDAIGTLRDRATGFVRGSPIVVSGTTTGSADDCRSYCSNVADEILAFGPAGTFSPDSFAFTLATSNCLCYRPVVCNYFTFDPAGDTIAGDRRT